MELFDVNIYVHAHRSDSSRHIECRELLESAYAEGCPVGYAPLALSGFLRIVTNPRVFRDPSELRTAFEFTRSVTGHPLSFPVTPGESHWAIFSHLCQEANARGNLIPDAYFAALAIESDSTWVSTDRDFRRFRDLRLKLV